MWSAERRSEEFLAGHTHREELPKQISASKNVPAASECVRLTARQKFIPAINTGSARPCRIGKGHRQ